MRSLFISCLSGLESCPLREDIRSHLGEDKGIGNPSSETEYAQEQGWHLPVGFMYAKKEAKSSGFVVERNFVLIMQCFVFSYHWCLLLI